MAYYTCDIDASDPVHDGNANALYFHAPAINKDSPLDLTNVSDALKEAVSAAHLRACDCVSWDEYSLARVREFTVLAQHAGRDVAPAWFTGFETNLNNRLDGIDTRLSGIEARLANGRIRAFNKSAVDTDSKFVPLHKESPELLDVAQLLPAHVNGFIALGQASPVGRSPDFISIGGIFPDDVVRLVGMSDAEILKFIHYYGDACGIVAADSKDDRTNKIRKFVTM